MYAFEFHYYSYDLHILHQYVLQSHNKSGSLTSEHHSEVLGFIVLPTVWLFCRLFPRSPKSPLCVLHPKWENSSRLGCRPPTMGVPCVNG